MWSIPLTRVIGILSEKGWGSAQQHVVLCWVTGAGKEIDYKSGGRDSRSKQMHAAKLFVLGVSGWLWIVPMTHRFVSTTSQGSQSRWNTEVSECTFANLGTVGT